MSEKEIKLKNLNFDKEHIEEQINMLVNTIKYGNYENYAEALLTRKRNLKRERTKLFFNMKAIESIENGYELQKLQ